MHCNLAIVTLIVVSLLCTTINCQNIYNLTIVLSAGSNLNLWFRIEQYQMGTTPWHFIGPLSSGTHKLSMNSGTDVLRSGTQYFSLWLGCYGDGTSDLLRVTDIEFIYDQTSTSGLNYNPTNGYSDWTCDQSSSGCCTVKFSMYNNDATENFASTCNNLDSFENDREGVLPTSEPTLDPTDKPSAHPTSQPTIVPTPNPTDIQPSLEPTFMPVNFSDYENGMTTTNDNNNGNEVTETSDAGNGNQGNLDNNNSGNNQDATVAYIVSGVVGFIACIAIIAVVVFYKIRKDKKEMTEAFNKRVTINKISGKTNNGDTILSQSNGASGSGNDGGGGESAFYTSENKMNRDDNDNEEDSSSSDGGEGIKEMIRQSTGLKFTDNKYNTNNNNHNNQRQTNVTLVVGAQNMNDLDVHINHNNNNRYNNYNNNNNITKRDSGNNIDVNMKNSNNNNKYKNEHLAVGSHKEENFGQMLTDSNVGGDLLMTDIINEVDNNDDQLLPGTNTSGGDGNMNNNNNDNSYYVTPMGPSDAELDKIVSNEIGNDNDNGGGGGGGAGGEMDVELNQDDVRDEMQQNLNSGENEDMMHNDQHDSDEDVLHVTPGR